MHKRLSKYQIALLFSIFLILIIICFIISILKTDAYNKVHHIEDYKGSDILSSKEDKIQETGVSIAVAPRRDSGYCI